RAQPRRGDGGRLPLHRRRRSRAPPGGERGQGPRAGIPAPYRTVRGARARARLRDPGTRARPPQRPGDHRRRTHRLLQRPRHRGRAGTARPAAPARGAQQGRRARGEGTRGIRAPGDRRTRLAGIRSLDGEPGGAARANAPAPEPERVVLRPAPVGRVRKDEFTITRKQRGGQEYFHVQGDKPERWIKQTNFENDEAVGYLADRLATLGVEEGLFNA